MADVGDLRDWLELGHDVYAVGVQECLPLGELRDAIHTFLGTLQSERECGPANGWLCLPVASGQACPPPPPSLLSLAVRVVASCAALLSALWICLPPLVSPGPG